jgi:D-aminopeptidase
VPALTWPVPARVVSGDVSLAEPATPTTPTTPVVARRLSSERVADAVTARQEALVAAAPAAAAAASGATAASAAKPEPAKVIPQEEKVVRQPTPSACCGAYVHCSH